MTTLPRFKKTAWASLLAGASVSSALFATLPVAAWAGESNIAVKTLADQARFWQNKGRGDLAAAAWKRLLQVEPKNPEALAGLAQFELDNNRVDAAKGLMDELKKQPQANREILRKLEATTSHKTVNQEQLGQARTAAKSGQTEDAVSKYRQLFEGRPVAGPLALEYYQTLGGTPSGWEDARKGLESMYTSDPSQERVALAYAQHLTYRAGTRREGIRMLSELARKPGVATAASEAWRKALIWLDAGKADQGLYQSFLNTSPNDQAVQTRMASLSQAYATKPLDARSLALRNAFGSLNIGQVSDAEKRFEGLLAAEPKNADALGGLGVVRLKQERFADAERLLAEAIRVSGNGKWKEALGTAHFWQAMDAGEDAMGRGDVARARQNFMKALQMDPKNARASIALADLLVQEGRLSDAERAYRSLRVQHPKSIDVLRGLATVLVRAGKVDEALALAEGLSGAEREELGYGTLKAEQYRRTAIALSAQGDAAGAMQQLEEALLWDPESPWLRLELARMYYRGGASSEAFGLMDGLLQTRPDMPDALHAAALMSADAKEWALGLSMLEKIPAKSRTREMADLQRKLWVRAQLEQVRTLTQAGQRSQALGLLNQLQTTAQQDPALLSDVAQLTLDLGDDARGLAMMRNLMAQGGKPNVGMQVAYAGLLLKAGQDVELATQLRHIYGQQLTADQQQEVDGIRLAYSLRQLDAQREAGQLAAAYEISAQLLTEKPNDKSAQLGLARIYSSAGEHGRALAWYHQVLQQFEPDVDTLVAAAGAATASGDFAYAQSALATANQMSPSDAAVFAGLGRLARAQGQNKLAVQYLEKAQQIAQAQKQAQQLGALAVNPVGHAPLAPSPLAGQNAVTRPIPNPMGGQWVAPSATNKPNTPAVPTYRPIMTWPQSAPTPPVMSPIGVAPAANAAPNVVPVADKASARTRDRANTFDELPPAPYRFRQVQYRPDADVASAPESTSPEPAPETMAAEPSIASTSPVVIELAPKPLSAPAQAVVVKPPHITQPVAEPKAERVLPAPKATPVAPFSAKAAPLPAPAAAVKPALTTAERVAKSRANVLKLTRQVPNWNGMLHEAQPTQPQAALSVDAPQPVVVMVPAVAPTAPTMPAVPVIAAVAAAPVVAAVQPAPIMAPTALPSAINANAMWTPPSNVPNAGADSVFAGVTASGGPMLMPVASYEAPAQAAAQLAPAPSRTIGAPPLFAVASSKQAAMPRPLPAATAPVASYAQAPTTLPPEALSRGTWDNPLPANPVVARGAGTLQREIDELRAERAGWVAAGGLWRNRSGDAGTSQLTDFSSTLQAHIPITQNGQLVLKADVVSLSAGRVSATDFNASQQFGTNVWKNLSGSVGSTREQQDQGAALSIGYETNQLKLDVGTTPLGFAVSNMVGGVEVTQPFGDVKVKLNLSRRAVTDSLLSYAGTVDDASGTKWGGVTTTGGRLELAVEDGPFGLYGYGALHALKGKNVVSNISAEVGAGTYYKLIKEVDSELTTGVNVQALGFKRNLSHYTLGHGGYFSPQSYFSIGIPLEWTGRSGRVAYRVDSQIGVQSFRQNSVAYFPGDATLQNQWETTASAAAAAAPAGVNWRTYYPSQSKSGLGFRLSGELEYRFAPQWSVGGKVAIDNASDYTQTSGLAYVRYFFEPMYSQVRFPPKTLAVGQ